MIYHVTPNFIAYKARRQYQFIFVKDKTLRAMVCERVDLTSTGGYLSVGYVQNVSNGADLKGTLIYYSNFEFLMV